MIIHERPVSGSTRGVRAPGVVLLLGLALLLAGCGGPVEIERPPAEDAAACRALADDLPSSVADLAAVPHQPRNAPGGAWGDPPITLTCGVDLPEGFGPASSCLDVDGVDWFAPDAETQGEGVDVTYVSVGLEPHVALHVPGRHRPEVGAAALVDVAPALKRHLAVGTACQ